MKPRTDSKQNLQLSPMNLQKVNWESKNELVRNKFNKYEQVHKISQLIMYLGVCLPEYSKAPFAAARICFLFSSSSSVLTVEGNLSQLYLAPDPEENKNKRNIDLFTSSHVFVTLNKIDVNESRTLTKIHKNIPDTPTSGSDIVMISGSTIVEEIIKRGF